MVKDDTIIEVCDSTDEDLEPLDVNYFRTKRQSGKCLHSRMEKNKNGKEIEVLTYLIDPDFSLEKDLQSQSHVQLMRQLNQQMVCFWNF